MSKRFVLFIGPKQSGKDTAADLLIKKGKSRQKLNFAGPLKEICVTVTGLPKQYFNDPLLKERKLEEPIKADRRFWRMVKKELVKYLPEEDPETDYVLYNIDRISITGLENRIFKTPREIMQQIGTDFIREKVLSDWHVMAAFSEQNLEKYENGKIYCVTDARFLNEYEYLKDKFGDDLVAYYIERPEAEEGLGKATHQSELEIQKLKELLPEENIIKNDGTLKQLEKKVLDLELPVASSKKSKGKKAKASRFVYGTRK